MQRVGAVWVASVLIWGVVFGCEEHAEKLVYRALPDANADAAPGPNAHDAGPDHGSRPTGSTQRPVTDVPESTTWQSPRDAGNAAVATDTRETGSTHEPAPEVSQGASDVDASWLPDADAGDLVTWDASHDAGAEPVVDTKVDSGTTTTPDSTSQVQVDAGSQTEARDASSGRRIVEVIVTLHMARAGERAEWQF
jgi:hypothetical protein